MAKQTKKNNKPKNDMTQLFATTPLGCACFFVSLGLCSFWFLALLFCFFFVFWFVVVFLKGWQSNAKVKDLHLIRCQFSHFRGCKIVFDCFIICFGPVVPLENHVKTMANAGITGRSLGFETQIRQFCLFMYLSKFV